MKKYLTIFLIAYLALEIFYDYFYRNIWVFDNLKITIVLLCIIVELLIDIRSKVVARL
jgi:hypothetical protein